MVVHHVPLRPTNSLNYDPWRLNTIINRSFGGEFIWAPVSPVCRRQFDKIGFNAPLLSENWHSIIRVDEWGSPRSSPKFSNPVIGRHSRPEPDKWPNAKRELFQCYPTEPDFEVRMLGAESYLRDLVGQVPKNWRLFAYDEITPKEFLQSIDFFVYFHHPLTLEAFGRAPAEAAAAGCVLVLPHYLRAIFGDGAIYCEPQDVMAIVRQYHSDPNAYGRQSTRGYDVVCHRYGPESLLRLAKETLARPNVMSESQSGSRWVNGASVRFALRVEYGIREYFRPALDRLVKRTLRALGRLSPNWILQLRSHS
jgi:hypothetical protein